VKTRLVLLASAALVIASPVLARDYGQQGTLFPVIEVDMLRMIEGKLRAAEASGWIDAANREFAKRSIEKVKRPPPVAGIIATIRSRAWLHDPTITIDQDLRDQKGRLIIAKGARVNPLDTVGLRQRLVFLDGDDPAQVAWAMRTTTALNAKLILTRGAPLALMRDEQRRFYFDQNGSLTAKFGIRHVPALVEQQGRALRVTELVTPRTSPGAPARPKENP
jgi:conjugal transfer pilus assembly protein TraW